MSDQIFRLAIGLSYVMKGNGGEFASYRKLLRSFEMTEAPLGNGFCDLFADT